MKKKIVAMGLALLVLGLIAACGDDSSARPSPEGGSYPVQQFADQGRDHLSAGTSYNAYNSNPPTSGPHAPAPAPWGVSATPLPKEVPVHNMEHGGVVIWLNCAAAPPLSQADCATMASQLGAIVRDAVAAGKLVVMTPYPDMEQRIALTAWRTLDAFAEFDEARVRDFIERHERAFNPEGF